MFVIISQLSYTNVLNIIFVTHLFFINKTKLLVMYLLTTLVMNE